MSTQIDISDGILKKENKVMGACDYLQVKGLLRVASDLCFQYANQMDNDYEQKAFENVYATVTAALYYLEDTEWTVELLSDISIIKEKLY